MTTRQRIFVSVFERVRALVALVAIEAIEATRLPASAPAPCTRASAGRRPLRCGLEVVLVEPGVVSAMFAGAATIPVLGMKLGNVDLLHADLLKHVIK